MNCALLSSKNMCWCTPADFFSQLDAEFHFTLDPAATEKSAKCSRFFTPEDDGLRQDWGGRPCSAIRHTADTSANGSPKHIMKVKSQTQQLLC